MRFCPALNVNILWTSFRRRCRFCKSPLNWSAAKTRFCPGLIENFFIFVWLNKIPGQHLWTLPNNARRRWIAPAQNLRYTVIRFDEAHQRNAGKKRTARNPSGTSGRYWRWENYRSCRTSARLWKRSWFRWELKPRKHCGKLVPKPRGWKYRRSIRLPASTACWHWRVPLRASENRAAGRGKGRPESVLSGTQAIKNGSRPKRFPVAPQHIQCTIFEAPCPFSVSPTFFTHSCVSSHLAKQENLRYYEDTKKEWVQCTK